MKHSPSPASHSRVKIIEFRTKEEDALEQMKSEQQAIFQLWPCLQQGAIHNLYMRLFSGQTDSNLLSEKNSEAITELITSLFEQTLKNPKVPIEKTVLANCFLFLKFNQFNGSSPSNNGSGKRKGKARNTILTDQSSLIKLALISLDVHCTSFEKEIETLFQMPFSVPTSLNLILTLIRITPCLYSHSMAPSFFVQISPAILSKHKKMSTVFLETSLIALASQPFHQELHKSLPEIFESFESSKNGYPVSRLSSFHSSFFQEIASDHEKLRVYLAILRIMKSHKPPQDSSALEDVIMFHGMSYLKGRQPEHVAQVAETIEVVSGEDKLLLWNIYTKEISDLNRFIWQLEAGKTSSVRRALELNSMGSIGASRSWMDLVRRLYNEIQKLCFSRELADAVVEVFQKGEEREVSIFLEGIEDIKKLSDLLWKAISSSKEKLPQSAIHIHLVFGILKKQMILSLKLNSSKFLKEILLNDTLQSIERHFIDQSAQLSSLISSELIIKDLQQ